MNPTLTPESPQPRHFTRRRRRRTHVRPRPVRPAPTIDELVQLYVRYGAFSDGPLELS